MKREVGEDYVHVFSFGLITRERRAPDPAELASGETAVVQWRSPMHHPLVVRILSALGTQEAPREVVATCLRALLAGEVAS